MPLVEIRSPFEAQTCTARKLTAVHGEHLGRSRGEVNERKTTEGEGGTGGKFELTARGGGKEAVNGGNVNSICERSRSLKSLSFNGSVGN